MRCASPSRGSSSATRASRRPRRRSSAASTPCPCSASWPGSRAGATVRSSAGQSGSRWWPAASSPPTSPSGPIRSKRSGPGWRLSWATSRWSSWGSRPGRCTASGPRRSIVVALPIVIAGVVLIAGLVGANPYGSDPVLGVVAGLVTAFAYAGYLIVVRRGQRDIRRLAGPLFWATLATTVASALAGVVVGDFDPIPRFPGHLWLVILALTAQVAGYLLINVSLPRLPSVVTSLLLLIQPVVTVFLAMLLLGEDPVALPARRRRPGDGRPGRRGAALRAAARIPGAHDELSWSALEGPSASDSPQSWTWPLAGCRGPTVRRAASRRATERSRTVPGIAQVERAARAGRRRPGRPSAHRASGRGPGRGAVPRSATGRSTGQPASAVIARAQDRARIGSDGPSISEVIVSGSGQVIPAGQTERRVGLADEPQRGVDPIADLADRSAADRGRLDQAGLGPDQGRGHGRRPGRS